MFFKGQACASFFEKERECLSMLFEFHLPGSCVAVCCSVLQRVAVSCSVLQWRRRSSTGKKVGAFLKNSANVYRCRFNFIGLARVWQCVAVCCSAWEFSKRNAIVFYCRLNSNGLARVLL